MGTVPPSLAYQRALDMVQSEYTRNQEIAFTEAKNYFELQQKKAEENELLLLLTEE